MRQTSSTLSTTARCGWGGGRSSSSVAGLAEGVFKEKLDRAEGHGGGRAGDVFVVVEIEEILAQFLIAELIG